jgi:hypothetical protein
LSYIGHIYFYRKSNIRVRNSEKEPLVEPKETIKDWLKGTNNITCNSNNFPSRNSSDSQSNNQDIFRSSDSQSNNIGQSSKNELGFRIRSNISSKDIYRFGNIGIPDNYNRY